MSAGNGFSAVGSRVTTMVSRVLPCVGMAAALAGCGGSSTTSTATKSATQSTTTVSQPTVPTSTNQPSSSFPELVKRVRSGVVRIEADTCDLHSIGTGVILEPRLVATVEHVVDQAAT